MGDEVPSGRTADDPQPGDFDAALKELDPALVEYHDGDPDAALRILVSVEGEDARRLERIAETQGKTPTTSSLRSCATPIVPPHSSSGANPA